MNDFFQLFHTLLELVEFSHDLLELYVNQILHKFLLHFLHRLLTCFDPHRRMNSSSFDLYFCFGLWHFEMATFLGIDDVVHFLLSENRLQKLTVIELDDLDFLLVFVENIQNRRGGLWYLLDLAVRDISIFLLVQKLNSLSCFHVEPSVEVSLAFFVGDSVGD